MSEQKVYSNKLVRDHIRAKIESGGALCEVRVIEDDAEFKQELLKKVIEEAGELAHAQTKEEFLSEYSDLMVVLDALTNLLEFSEADIKTAMSENVEKKGFYKQQHFLQWSSDRDYKSNESPQGIA